MLLLLEQVLNGCAVGSLYGLFAIGFGLVFSTLGILNAAHGTYASFAAIAGYYAATSLGLPFVGSLVVGVLAGAVLALLVDQLAFQPLRRHRAGMPGGGSHRSARPRMSNSGWTGSGCTTPAAMAPIQSSAARTRWPNSSSGSAAWALRARPCPS